MADVHAPEDCPLNDPAYATRDLRGAPIIKPTKGGFTVQHTVDPLTGELIP